MSRTKQNARLLDSVIKPVFADKLPPREPTLTEMIDAYIRYDKNWTPENDGIALDLGRAIRSHLKANFGLTETQCDALGDAL